MAVDTTLLTDYTWAQIKLAAKHAMMSAAVGGNELRMQDGRSIGRISIAEAKALYELADAMDAAESDESPGGIALVQYGERV